MPKVKITPKTYNINDFASLIAAILKSDRWCLIAFDGEMGEGKSCISSQLAAAIAKYSGTKFSYQGNMTFLRSELKKWIDGDGETKKGQKSERSAVLADELISMFYKRNWHDANQIDGIELLNKCRDRHLAVLGNIPHFWDLDKGLYPMVTYRVHVSKRGRAYIFEKDANPFVLDKWNQRYNEKVYGKSGSPYNCRGFVGTLVWDDWPPEEKEEYYEVRNKKRVDTEGQRSQNKNYAEIKKERDRAIRHIFEVDPNATTTNVAKICGVHQTHVSRIKNRVG